MLLDVQIGNCQRIFLDELPSWLNVVAHEGRKDFIGFDRIIDFYQHQSPGFRVNGGVPQLVRVHFAKTFVPLNRLPTSCFAHEPVNSFCERSYRLLFFTTLDIRALTEQAVKFACERHNGAVLVGGKNSRVM